MPALRPSRRKLKWVAGFTGSFLVCLLAAFFILDHLFPLKLDRWLGRSTVVVDQSGHLLRPFQTRDGTWRLPTTVDQVDPLYLAMLKAVEDSRYDWHFGVDPIAASRALVQAATHGRIVSGASTLTMQTARLLEPKPRTLAAKLDESFRAFQLFVHFGRKDVLDIYLTLAPFGGALEGVTAASLAWFGKQPQRLTPAEAALLVALPQLPERLRPDRFPEAAHAARNRVLDRAAEEGVIQPNVAEAAKAEPVPNWQRPMPMKAAHLAEWLAGQAKPGSVIKTTINGEAQQKLERLGRAIALQMEAKADLAIVILSNRDRRLVAHLGSADWTVRQLDLSRSIRSPGSTLKPFIYATAFDDLSLHPGTLIPDAPQRFGEWAPKNFDRDFHGQISAKQALQRSLNIPAVMVLEKVGPARMAALLRQAGANITFPPGGEPGLPLALGGVGVKLTDLTLLYSALADDGKILPLRVTAEQSEPTAPRRFISETAARVTVDILRESPPPPGLASGRAVARQRPIGYKTGTSYGYRDAWALGSSNDYTVGVWVGRPDGSPRPGHMGGNTAAPILYQAFDLLPPDRSMRSNASEPSHALYQKNPPAALARFFAMDDMVAPTWNPIERLSILFPPDGVTIESLKEGISLNATGGSPPYRWIANGAPLEPGAAFWRPDGDGFARLVVLDSDGRRAMATIRVQTPTQD